MPTLNPGYFDVGCDHEPDIEPVVHVAAIAPDAMHDGAAFVSWVGLAVLAITVAGALFTS